MTDKEKEKNVRRAAKRALTRALNAVYTLISAKRPTEEILRGFEEAKAAHVDLARRHGAYCIFLNDEEYAEDEQWMAECTINTLGLRSKFTSISRASKETK